MVHSVYRKSPLLKRTDRPEQKGLSNRYNCSLDTREWSVSLGSKLFVPQTAKVVKWNNIEIKHGFSCINIRQVPWEVLKTEAVGRGFQHLPRDLANVNALQKHVWSLLLHKKWKHLLHFALSIALFCFAFSPMSRERNFLGLCSF